MDHNEHGLRLYSYWRSTASYRVRIALELKKLRYELRTVNLAPPAGEQHQLDYAGLNPLRQVPTLEFQRAGRTETLTQSVAIIEFLDEHFKTPRLLPSEIMHRARAREIVEIANSGMQPLQNLSVLLEIENLGGERIAWTRPKLERGFVALEAIVSKTASTYSVGSDPSIADVFLIPQLYAARRFQVDLEPYPTLLRIEAHCSTIEAFKNAHPDRQPDAPAKSDRADQSG